MAPSLDSLTERMSAMQDAPGDFDASTFDPIALLENAPAAEGLGGKAESLLSGFLGAQAAHNPLVGAAIDLTSNALSSAQQGSLAPMMGIPDQPAPRDRFAEAMQGRVEKHNELFQQNRNTDQEAPEAAPSASTAGAVVEDEASRGTLDQLQARLAGLLPGSEDTY